MRSTLRQLPRPSPRTRERSSALGRPRPRLLLGFDVPRNLYRTHVLVPVPRGVDVRAVGRAVHRSNLTEPVKLERRDGLTVRGPSAEAIDDDSPNLVVAGRTAVERGDDDVPVPKRAVANGRVDQANRIRWCPGTERSYAIYGYGLVSIPRSGVSPAEIGWWGGGGSRPLSWEADVAVTRPISSASSAHGYRSRSPARDRPIEVA